MADILLSKSGARELPLSRTFDITSITAKAVGGFINYYSFNTDGTMAVLRTQGGLIKAWDHYLGDGTILQSASAGLPLQPFLDIMGSRNPSSVEAFNYLMSGDDTITGSRAGDILDGRGGNDTLIGNNGNDHLSGGLGNDTLTGGIGHDRLKGGDGSDTFNFSSMLDGGDIITDFQAGIDHIGLDAAAFGFSGPLADGTDFIAAAGLATPTGSGPTLLYDLTSGVLSYDADGNGVGPAQVLATLTNHAALAVADFLLI